MTNAGIPKRPKRIVYSKQKVTSGDLSYIIPKHDAGYDDEEVDKWFKEVADQLEKEIDEAKKARQIALNGGEEYIPCYLEGYIKAKKELLEAIR